jgi:hypothetical protein
MSKPRKITGQEYRGAEYRLWVRPLPGRTDRPHIRAKRFGETGKARFDFHCHSLTDVSGTCPEYKVVFRPWSSQKPAQERWQAFIGTIAAYGLEPFRVEIIPAERDRPPVVDESSKAGTGALKNRLEKKSWTTKP